MAGVLGLGRQNATQAREGFSQVAGLKRQRENQNDQIEAADDAAQASNTATGATAGWMVGAEAGSVGGPWGMAIGAAAGYLMSEWL